jgi:hypothetical protein
MVARYNFAKVTFDGGYGSIIPDRDVDVKAGGFQVGGGLRLRF